MRKLRALFHPIFIFVGVQIAWVILMAVWINWYIKNSRRFNEFAQQLNPMLSDNDFNWVILLEGCFLMLIILAGVYFIFVYWNKQARLNRLQSNFVSSVSHELKSPLASIQLYLETLKYQHVSSEETRDFVETMLADTARLSTLIENILEASRSDPKSMQLRFEPIDMGTFLREVVADFKRQLEEKHCEPVIKIEDSPLLYIDKRAMRMVFNNLISNALRYSPQGASLVVTVKKDKKYLNIAFADTGIGLLKKDVKRVFRKFYRVQSKDTHNIEGAGLGLYISSEIVKNHKGKISVESEGRGKGSTFTISLPLESDHKEQK